MGVADRHGYTTGDRCATHTTMTHALKARLDAPLRRLTGGRVYLAYTIRAEEHIGSDSDARGYLEASDNWQTVPTILGISLEAAKYHWDTGEVHTWSYKRVDPDNPRKQWHVHAWRNGDIACHHEYRARMQRVGGESPRGMIDRLRMHYRGVDYRRGDAPPDIIDALSD